MNSHLCRVAFGILPWLAGESISNAVADDVSFRNDVMAVLSKAGCNRGVCHGNKHGKGGFKLSLRGQNADFDYAALSRRQSARRANLIDPAKSLVLRKPTMQTPHEGDVASRSHLPSIAFCINGLPVGCRVIRLLSRGCSV